MVDDIDFMSPRQQAGGYAQNSLDSQSGPSFSAPQPMPAAPAPQRPAAVVPPKQEDVYDEDIPF